MAQKFSLENKRAVVTGAASGIGKAIAETFARAGAEVWLLDIDEGAVQHAANALQREGLKGQFLQCDITQLEAVKDVFGRIRRQGPMQILVNNAGVAHVGNVEDTAPEDFDRVMQVNVYGMYHCLHTCLPHMRADGGGAIVNIASTLSSVAIPNRFAYGTSKGAVLTMTYSVALDYIEHGIRCNAISPGRVHTPFVDGFITKNYPGREAEMLARLSSDHPIGRMAQPQEIADLALFLCSDEASYITGSNHSIDGGFTHLVKT